MRGRFAPSPTGVLHLGNLRTGLLAYLFAASAGSSFVLRFEDLDPGSVRDEFYDAQRRDLDRLGIAWESELRQLEHLDRYADAIADLTDRGLTYPCFCSRREIREAAAAPNGPRLGGRYPGTCRNLSAAEQASRRAEGREPAIRIRTDGHERSFVDRVAGPQAGPVDDQVLARRDGIPAYNLVVVLDDHHQQVEEVVRADDLLTSTPGQIHLASLFSIPAPSYAHVPLALGPEGKRLAKRDGAVTLDEQLDLGRSVVEVRSRLAASAGLCPPGEQPTMQELIDTFDPARITPEPWTVR